MTASARTLRSLLPAATVTLVTIMALLCAMAVGSALMLAYGASPAGAWLALLRGTWGNAYGVGEVLYRATSLIFAGLAVAVGFQAGLFNIGAEGQLTLAAFATAFLGAHLGGLPAILALPACLVCALAAGAAAGFLPGLLRATTGAHEGITTLMLNAVIAGVLLWAGGRWLFLREQIHTAAIAPSAELSPLGRFLHPFAGSKVSTAFLLALAAAALYHVLLTRTVLGLHLRAVGAGPRAAEAAGVPVARTIVLALTLSGALAGLAGFSFVCGYKHYYETGFGGGVGFLGIAVALLGRNRAGGIVLAALLFGTLEQGGFAISAQVPRDVVLVLQAVVILAVAAASPATRRLLATLARPAAEESGGAGERSAAAGEGTS